jgi:hypothetical protein
VGLACPEAMVANLRSVRDVIRFEPSIPV